MNIFHYVMVGIYLFGFLISLHNHGKPKEEKNYSAVSTFWACCFMITLIWLSSK